MRDTPRGHLSLSDSMPPFSRQPLHSSSCLEAPACKRRAVTLLAGLAMFAISFLPPPPLAAQLLPSGSNSCPLQMRTFAPSSPAQDMPLVVALHGCDQTSEEFEVESGWSELAERYRFVVLYVAQPRCNNPIGCFTWFEADHIKRGGLSTGQIKDMIDSVKGQHSIDPDRVFVTGISAGGAMAVSLLAVYPEQFAGGAVVASLPYGIANTSHEAWPAMLVGVNKSPEAWGDLVRETHPGYQGPYPTLSIFHGTADRAVNPVNQRELVEQWTNLHHTDASPDSESTVAGHDRKVYRDADGHVVVESWTIEGMGHALPVDPGDGPGQGGSTGKYAKDVDLYSSYHALKFWQLID